MTRSGNALRSPDQKVPALAPSASTDHSYFTANILFVATKVCPTSKGLASWSSPMPDMARYDPFSPTFDHPLTNSSPDYGSRNGSFRTRPVSDFGAIGTPLSFRERNKRLRNLDDEKNQLIEVCAASTVSALPRLWRSPPC